MATRANVPAVIRWKNGDRQFITAEMLNGHPRDEIMWKVGSTDGGGHSVGDIALLRYLTRTASRLVYVEYP